MGGKLHGTDRELDVLLRGLAQEAANREAEFITLFYGEDVTEEQANTTTAIFAEVCPEAELTTIRGGQPVYYYIISIE